MSGYAKHEKHVTRVQHVKHVKHVPHVARNGLPCDPKSPTMHRRNRDIHIRKMWLRLNSTWRKLFSREKQFHRSCSGLRWCWVGNLELPREPTCWTWLAMFTCLRCLNMVFISNMLSIANMFYTRNIFKLCGLTCSTCLAYATCWTRLTCFTLGNLSIVTVLQSANF